MQGTQSRWIRMWLGACVAIGLTTIGYSVPAEENFAGPIRRLSDSQTGEPWQTTRETSFHIVDTGPVNGPPDVPSQLPPPPPEAAPVTVVAPLPKADDMPGPHKARSPNHDVSVIGHSCREEGWLDNTFVFLAGDGWRNIFDEDHNSNFGFRAGFNMGIELPGDRATMAQLGMSYGGYDFHGREQLLSRDDPIEQQMFATAGLFKRSNICEGDRFAWGAVYDLLVADEAGEQADSLRLGQLRTHLGLALNESDEIGVWTAFRLMRDFAPGQHVPVNVTDQANLFWHHNWSQGADTWAYVGWADDPGSVVVGLRGEAPLNSRVALLGNIHYIIPSTRGGDVHPLLGVDNGFNQEAWNVSFGIAIYRCAKAIAPTVSGVRGVPLLPVADNGTLSYQANMIR